MARSPGPASRMGRRDCWSEMNHAQGRAAHMALPYAADDASSSWAVANFPRVAFRPFPRPDFRCVPSFRQMPRTRTGREGVRTHSDVSSAGERCGLPPEDGKAESRGRASRGVHAYGGHLGAPVRHSARQVLPAPSGQKSDRDAEGCPAGRDVGRRFGPIGRAAGLARVSAPVGRAGCSRSGGSCGRLSRGPRRAAKIRYDHVEPGRHAPQRTRGGGHGASCDHFGTVRTVAAP